MKKKFFIIIAILLSVVLIGTSCVLAENDAMQNLQDQKQDVQNQIDQTNEELLEIQNEMTDTLRQIASLQERINGYESEVAELNSKLKNIQQAVQQTEEKLAETEEHYQKQKKASEERIIALYESGETTYLDILLHSSTLTEFISNYYIIAQLAENDVDLLESVERQKNKIELEKQALDVKKEQVKTLKQKQEKVAVVLENTKIVYNNYMGKLTDKELQVQKKLNEYEEKQKQIEQEIQVLLAQNVSEQYLGGEMAWPAPGYTRITSPYGMRTHPITGVYKLHTGTDIGAPYGSNFIAAADGVVVKATYNTAYGNMVIIDHGGGVSTLYAHGSQIIAKQGDVVKKGDIILKVGSTGYSTGPHAHFEVRVDGKCVDPMPYITKTQANKEETTKETNNTVAKNTVVNKENL